MAAFEVFRRPAPEQGEPRLPLALEAAGRGVLATNTRKASSRIAKATSLRSLCKILREQSLKS
jgi:hypothetical protein